MSLRSAPWLSPSAPWLEPAPHALCAEAKLSPDAIPVVERIGAQPPKHELVALRSNRYVPLFGSGDAVREARRALENMVAALSESADIRAVDHAIGLVTHPRTMTAPLSWLAQEVNRGAAPAYCAEVALAYTAVLGASDTTREQVARALEGIPALRVDAALALCVGGGDYSSWREHYGSLSAHDAMPLRAARAWFDWVLARRFSGLETLESLLHEADILDGATRWLCLTGVFLAGREGAREQLITLAQSLLGPLQARLPRLFPLCARDLAEATHRPLALRWAHLRCAAARDHGAMAIRAWLNAASQSDDDDFNDTRVLGPEPSRAAAEARAAAGEFLLDWFVSDREARENVDSFARAVVRMFHRLHGAQLFQRAITAGAML